MSPAARHRDEQTSQSFEHSERSCSRVGVSPTAGSIDPSHHRSSTDLLERLGCAPPRSAATTASRATFPGPVGCVRARLPACVGEAPASREPFAVGKASRTTSTVRAPGSVSTSPPRAPGHFQSARSLHKARSRNVHGRRSQLGLSLCGRICTPAQRGVFVFHLAKRIADERRKKQTEKVHLQKPLVFPNVTRRERRRLRWGCTAEAPAALEQASILVGVSALVLTPTRKPVDADD